MLIFKRVFILFARKNIVSSLLTIFKPISLKLPNMAQTKDDLIREKLNKLRCPLQSIPNVLSIDSEGVFINDIEPYEDIIKELERVENHNTLKNYVLTPKLKNTETHNDWYFCVSMINANYFESKESLDEMLVAKEIREIGSKCIQADKITLREAFKALMVDVSCDMEHYLKNKNELEADLNRSISVDLDVENELVIKKLEQEN